MRATDQLLQLLKLLLLLTEFGTLLLSLILLTFDLLLLLFELFLLLTNLGLLFFEGVDKNGGKLIVSDAFDLASARNFL